MSNIIEFVNRNYMESKPYKENKLDPSVEEWIWKDEVKDMVRALIQTEKTITAMMYDFNTQIQTLKDLINRGTGGAA